MSQLPLELKLKPHASFESFVRGANSVVVSHLQAIATGQRAESIWVYGPPSVGKSHLLAAACRAAGDARRRAIYLSLGNAGDAGALHRLEPLDLVALDDIGGVARDPAWEAALFEVFDQRLQRGGLVIAAEKPPREIGFELPDLISRAGAAVVYKLEHLGDEHLLEAVLGHAAMRGLELEASSASYLLERFSRDLGALTDGLDRVDRFSLSAQRRITIPLLREVLDL